MSRSVDIVFIINSLSGGGAERIITLLLDHFQRTQPNLKLALVTLDNRPDAYAPPTGVVRYQLFPTRVPRALHSVLMPVQLLFLIILLRKLQPRTAMSFLLRSNLLLSATAMFGVQSRIVISERTLSRQHYKGRLSPVLFFLIRHLYSRAHAVIAISRAVVSSLVAIGVDKKNIITVYNPVNVNAQAHKDLPSKDLYTRRDRQKCVHLIAAGRLVEAKGFDILIRAVAELTPGSVRLDIFGDGPLRNELVSQSLELGLGEVVALHSWTANLRGEMLKRDVFVLPSRREAFGNVLVEAMAAGLPVIAFQGSGGPDEILRGGNAGILVPMEDVRSLAGAIDKLRTQPKERDEYRRRGNERALDFNVESIANEYYDILMASKT